MTQIQKINKPKHMHLKCNCTDIWESDCHLLKPELEMFLLQEKRYFRK